MSAPEALGHDVATLRSLAEEVASRAAQLARELTREGVEVAATKSSEVDVVTRVDQECERLIRELLVEARPDDEIWGEEEGKGERGTSGVRWVVDPIDGTVNLLYGLPECAVSVAAQVDGVTIAGAVVRVGDATVWSAGLGLGATRNGARLQVRPVAPLSQSLVLTGFGYQQEVRAHQGACVAALVPQVRDIRRMGSCAIDLCLLAEGRADAYVEDGPQEWDHAAGRLVLTEAGGRFELLPSPLAQALDGWPDDSVLVGAPAGSFDSFVVLLRKSGFVAG